MSGDDTADRERDPDPLAPDEEDPLAPGAEADTGDDDGGGRLSESADRAVESFDEGVIDLLSWVLDTETRARIYVHLRSAPDATSKEIAEGTGLYPSTVREALAEMHEDGVVTRHKRESEGAGNNPYEYAAIAPSELVAGAVDQIQGELNAVFRLDDRLGGDGDGDEDDDGETTAGGDDPVTITVEDGTDAGRTALEVDDADDGGETTVGGDDGDTGAETGTDAGTDTGSGADDGDGGA